jgi:hypothetical protein
MQRHGQFDKALAGGLCLLALTAVGAAGYENRQGPAVLRLDAEEKAGRVEIPLSGTTLTLTIQGGPGLAVTQPRLLIQPASWKYRKVAPPRIGAEKDGWQQQYHIEPPDRKTETLDLEVALQYGQPPHQVQWKIPVRVTTEIGSVTMGELRGTTGPEEVTPAESWWPVVAALLTALVLAVLGLVIWGLVRRRLRRKVVLTPDAWAVRELDRLTALDLSADGTVERFPTLLSDVVRRYLELRFRVQAPRQTTAEFLAAMQQSPQLTPDQQAELRTFLERCDLAKFARAIPSADECRALATRARGFVEQTAAVQGRPGDTETPC